MATMKSLLKAYSLPSDHAYFQMIIASIINGQHSQAKEQFLAMSKYDRWNMIECVTIGSMAEDITDGDKRSLFNWARG